MTTIEKFMFGCNNNLDWAIKEAVEEGVDPVTKFEQGCKNKIDWLIKQALEEENFSPTLLLTEGCVYGIDWLIKLGAQKATPKQKLTHGYIYGIVWLVKEALDEGADPSEDDNAALRRASYTYYPDFHINGDKTNVEILELLLKDPRVDPSAQNNYALRFAIQATNHFDVVKKLLKDPRLKRFNSLAGSDLLTWTSNAKMIKLLLSDKRISSTLNTIDVMKWREFIN